jgi:hypothetical protein
MAHQFKVGNIMPVSTTAPHNKAQKRGVRWGLYFQKKNGALCVQKYLYLYHWKVGFPPLLLPHGRNILYKKRENPSLKFLKVSRCACAPYKTQAFCVTSFQIPPFQIF